MESKKLHKLKDAVETLRDALRLSSKNVVEEHLSFLMIVKSFEVAIEYAWKEMKLRVENEGLFAPSPKEAVRKAAKLGIISNGERWIVCINARNNSVHDYFAISKEDYVNLAKEFLSLVEQSSLCFEIEGES